MSQSNIISWPLSRKAIVLIIGTILFLFALVNFSCAVSFVDNYEMGFTYNKFTGEIKELDRTGWYLLNPWKYSVHSIDCRPYQVAISANQRILNAKLVKFNKAGLRTFIEWHGRDAGDQTVSLLEILKCYAFDKNNGTDCPFLTVVGELSPNQAPDKDSVGALK